jgi:hypothetical protein
LFASLTYHQYRFPPITVDLLYDFFRRALTKTTLFDVILTLRSKSDAIVFTDGAKKKPTIRVLKTDQGKEIYDCLMSLKSLPDGSVTWHTAGALSVVQTLIIT